MNMLKEDYMGIALDEAIKAFNEDEVPIGCVIVKDDEIIAKAHNQKVKNNNATHHAEMLAIDQATKSIGNWHLDDCEMYVTLEPCLMCTGAIINSRIKKVYFATADPKGGALVSNLDIYSVKNLNHYPEIEQGCLQEASSELLKKFFKNKRQNHKK